MPNVSLNKETVMKLIGKKIPDDTLKDRISMLGTDLDQVTDKTIDVEIFPNRPDMLSEQGFARSLSAFMGIKTGLRKFKVNKSNFIVNVQPSIKSIRPYTMCAVVKGIKFTNEVIEEIINIQEKLHVSFCRNRKKAAIGIYPLEKIKFPIKYFAEDPKKIKFIPLEGNKPLTGLQILSQHQKGREYAYLLEGLKKFPFFEDANKQILSMPPIINSEKTGKITKTTTDVFIEASGFDLNTLTIIINILSTMFHDMQGTVYEVKVKYGNKTINSPDLKPKTMALDLKYVNKLLGLELKEAQAKTLLQKMGMDYTKGLVSYPAYRADILHPIDLVEDIAIAYGYENFQEEIPNISTIGEESQTEILKRKVAEIIIGLGYLECSSYHLASEQEQNEQMNTKLKTIKLKNSLSLEYNVLRSWIIPNLLSILARNKKYDYPQKIFEIGRVFKNGISETGTIENERVAVVSSHQTANFTEIKQVLDYVLRMLDLEYTVKEVEHPSFISGRCARISVNKKDVAFIGEIHPSVLENFGIEFPTCALELNLSELF
ncbi:MAG: phenylalanine--tRNA ligase subunit beta [archaeon]